MDYIMIDNMNESQYDVSSLSLLASLDQHGKLASTTILLKRLNAGGRRVDVFCGNSECWHLFKALIGSRVRTAYYTMNLNFAWSHIHLIFNSIGIKFIDNANVGALSYSVVVNKGSILGVDIGLVSKDPSGKKKINSPIILFRNTRHMLRSAPDIDPDAFCTLSGSLDLLNQTDKILRVLYRLDGMNPKFLSLSSLGFSLIRKSMPDRVEITNLATSFNETYEFSARGGTSYSKMFSALFPAINTKFVLENIKPSFLGGFNFVNKEYTIQDTECVPIYELDAVSMYSTILGNAELPCGYINATSDSWFWESDIYSTARLSFRYSKKDQAIPIDLIKFYNRKNAYRLDGLLLGDSQNPEEGIFEGVLSNVDYRIIEKYYDLSEVDISEFYVSNGICNGMDVFGNFLNIIEKGRGSSDKIVANIFKDISNMTIGKFGQIVDISPVKEVPHLRQFFLNYVKSSKSEYKEYDPYYMPIAACVASLGRKVLLETIEKYIKWENWIYSDTDSIFTFKDISETNIKTQFGIKWRKKNHAGGKFIASKAYVVWGDYGEKVVVAGLSNSSKYINRDNFIVGKRFSNVNPQFRFNSQGVMELTYGDFTLGQFDVNNGWVGDL